MLSRTISILELRFRIECSKQAGCREFAPRCDQLRAAGCGSRNIYREKATGARPDRRELNRMLGKLAPGDVVTVTRIADAGKPMGRFSGRISTITYDAYKPLKSQAQDFCLNS
jgi:hypothetical protein